MKKTLWLGASLLTATFYSCIGEEPKNNECDIESVSVHVDQPTKIFYKAGDTLCTVPYDKTNIEYRIRNGENVWSLPLTLRTTAGSTTYIVDEEGKSAVFQNGSEVDFADEKRRIFRVVSEDGAWNREYTITFVHDVPTEGDMKFDFEEFQLDATGKFYEWHISDPKIASIFTDGMWKNGNPGFKLSMSTAKADAYPSVPLAGEGPDGSTCVKLETKNTGSFGTMAGMPLASGSMFNGVFDVTNALKNALKATRFGSPFAHKPIKMTAWLKWEAGTTYKNKTTVVADITDEPDAYIVFYRNQDSEGNEIVLDGNDVLSSPYIVGKGRLNHNYNPDGSDCPSNSPQHGLTSEWQLVELPVEYTSELDPEILANKGYSIIIGFASSWQGAYFNGAVGSKLYIDNVSIYCDKDED